ncbi:MAG: arginine--tRNA ligase [Candidatus Magasanikbacteria bacterium]|jgi:arginyl-tRNA synthetase|nr:arginine--tRNA ligase [Candidatus Magasanikbacteria bacterium]MBT6294408.1 arginine--tRNA ligase [Candidatus Magasanikbacteria bacterium]
MNSIVSHIEPLLESAGLEGPFVFSTPPNMVMGDIALACFPFAKQLGKSPVDVAHDVQEKITEMESDVISRVEVSGPYLNFFIERSFLASYIMEEVLEKGEDYGKHLQSKKTQILVEYGCPNPLKAFHLGHVKNLITGESVARVLENAGYDVKRVNYQGDVGMHVAKSLWGIYNVKEEFDALEHKTTKEKIAFLGKAYVSGSKHFEKGEKEKAEIVAYNKRVYTKDPSIQEVYKEAVAWSLTYFDEVYKEFGTRFDALYFESQMFERGVEIVQKGLKKDVFTKSDGAIIFKGSEYGLHDRVFINSEGFPTYEAKDLALAENHIKDFSPEKIIHVVGKEQTEYFKVVFKAMEQTLPESVGKEHHIPGGFLQLKGDKKMSSRTGSVITGDTLVQITREEVENVMAESVVSNKSVVVGAVAMAAIKYTTLKSDITKDVAFDIEDAVKIHGESGPYLLYIGARITSILHKSSGGVLADTKLYSTITDEEKRLLLLLGQYPDITKKAAETYDPSHVARYLFDMAQCFNTFYTKCPVLQSEEEQKQFRLSLLRCTYIVLENGLSLLGISLVDEM